MPFPTIDAPQGPDDPPADAAESPVATVETAALTQAAILSQLAEGVIVTDEAGHITLVNEAAAAIHGVTRLDVPPDAYSRTYHLFTEDGAPHPPFDLPLARAVRGETVRDARWRIRRPDGVVVLAIGSAQPLRDLAGRQIGAVLTLRDDTAREAAERSLRDLNATLAQRVEARTREAETVRAEAERASAAKSDFLATMSHEIRTPLNGVIGYTDLLTEVLDPGTPAARYAERIRTAGAALLMIVDDILDFSALEAGRITLASEPFALGGLIDNALSIVRASAERKGLRLTVEAEDDLPHDVCGDQDRLRQVLLNLINNAIKFTDRGRVTLRLSRLEEADGTRLRFAVTDTGIGIPADKQHLLFERFSQVDGTIRREFGGTGLGLAISKRLVERMGGTVGVASAPSYGSTFWFDVALPPAAAPAPGPARASATQSIGRRVLLVEDVPLNQELASTVLRAGGHTVDVAGSGAEAIAVVQIRPYDVVLMDVQMPGMDGLTAARRIRALNHPCAGVPIIAMTANVLPQQVSATRAAGMVDHVGKPFRRETLLAAVARHARAAEPETSRAAQSTVESAADLLDAETFATLVDTLGADHLHRLLAELAEELAGRFGGAEGTAGRDELAFDAHAMVSASGVLGFTRLATLCQELEAACHENRPYAAALERLRAMRAQVLELIRARRAQHAAAA